MRQHEHEHRKWQDQEHQRSHRRSYHNQHAEGEIGHWVRTAGILAPLIISEFVKDPDRKWRFIRIASVSAAIISEGLHAHKSYKQRERDKEALEACETSCLTPLKGRCPRGVVGLQVGLNAGPFATWTATCKERVDVFEAALFAAMTSMRTLSLCGSPDRLLLAAAFAVYESKTCITGLGKSAWNESLNTVRPGPFIHGQKKDDDIRIPPPLPFPSRLYPVLLNRERFNDEEALIAAHAGASNRKGA